MGGAAGRGWEADVGGVAVTAGMAERVMGWEGLVGAVVAMVVREAEAAVADTATGMEVCMAGGEAAWAAAGCMVL